MRFFDALSLGGFGSVFGTALGFGLGYTEVGLAAALVGWLLFGVAFVSMTDWRLSIPLLREPENPADLKRAEGVPGEIDAENAQ